MTGTIEPAGAHGSKGEAAGPHQSDHQADDQVDPSLVPSVAEHARAGLGTLAKVTFAALGLAFIAGMGFVLWQVVLRPIRVEAPKPSAPTVASASAGRKSFDPVLPSTVSGVRRAAEDGEVPAVPGVDSSKNDPIGAQRNSPNAGRSSAGRSQAAATSEALVRRSEDAPVLPARPAWAAGTARASAPTEGSSEDPLAETRASLAQYRQQLSRSLETLQTMIPAGTGQTAATVTARAGSTRAPVQPSTGTGVGGRGVLGLQASDTPPARAETIGNRSLVLPQGTSLTCALTTRVVSAQAGFIGCQVLRNVFGADGRVLLIERGSHLDGEYRVTQVRPGTTRIPALWTRLRTPGGVTVDLDSPATGPLGESGADAFVDNRWFERVGAAMLVSILDDSIKIVLNNETAPQQGNNSLVFQGTGQMASQMADKVLDATINLPPLLTANQGSLVGVYVARDVDFSSVYELQPIGK
jgi:type IV secretion system protein VirB10